MAPRRNTETENLQKQVIVLPVTNDWQAVPSVVPARFNSTSEPIQSPIIRPELDSPTELKCSGGVILPSIGG